MECRIDGELQADDLSAQTKTSMVINANNKFVLYIEQPMVKNQQKYNIDYLNY